MDPFRVIPPPSAVASDGLATEPNSIFLSSTVNVTVLIVVVVPLTVKSPETTRFPPTFKFSLIPTPPKTTNAPEPAVPDVVLDDTKMSFVNVFTPANDCANVDTRPVAPVPAIGILNVWVEPADSILKPVPEDPTTKNCVLAVKPFKVNPLPDPPEETAHFKPDAVVLSAVRT